MKARGLIRVGHEYQPYVELFAAVIMRAVLDVDHGGETGEEAEAFLQDVLEDEYRRLAGRKRKARGRQPEAS